MITKGDMRRVQVTGGASYVVALPKSWARSVGLKPKDLVALIPQADMSLLVIPRGAFREERPSEALVRVPPGADREEVIRDYISHYLAGYDIIRLSFGQHDPSLRAYVKDTIRRKLIGVEIVEESAEAIATQCLPGYTDLPLKKALERMSLITSSMQRDSLKALKDGDRALAQEVVQRDDEVDRFYHFIARQLRMAVQSRSMMEDIGLESPRDCLGYGAAAKSVERAADHSANISRVIMTFDAKLQKGVLDAMGEMGRLSNHTFDDSISSLFRLDPKLAHQAMSEAKRVVELEGGLTRSLLASKISSRTVVGLKLILESLRRIAEYGADVAEVTVNLTVKGP